MEKVRVIGGAVTLFAKQPDRNMKSLAEEAVTGALKNANVEIKDLGGAWVGNCVQGIFDGQEMIRGQVVLHTMGIHGIPIINVENACASSATALNAAWAQVALGEIDVALVLGMEKMFSRDKAKSMAIFNAAMDVEILSKIAASLKASEADSEKNRGGNDTGKKKKTEDKSIFMDLYASGARAHMEQYGLTQRQLAVVASKNHFHSSMNRLAQYQKEFSVDEVMNDVEVAFPLTRLMCSPIGDGAAAAVICSDSFATKIGRTAAPEIAACLLTSGEPLTPGGDGSLTMLAKSAYERAGIGPQDIDIAEVHDATAFGEISSTEALMFCAPGEGGQFAEAGNTTLGGSIPVNVSGGLECQGHPVGATGIRQVVELYWHLTNQVGKRQVEGARIGLAQNAGGSAPKGAGALSVTILKV
ncbi:MAG: thiolase family protein [Pseudomonadales bacterium]|jgi:acetyl-CoA acetyltransferase|nr:thiolase [Gammaproteobacteria bacterium]MDP6027464.1 thiolase family protein [Pseudomonadales bacterium]MDP6315375.1 thiolase family protein [Pseudomonadales bacterium]MDP7315430.1 thiolase family protein [Pseudomonadales bacterium]MDP7577665.1 thiolase family protein [Pseudomonadales bacterium]|tara:strand:- start:4741 stop:5985 length:1245 start_codon:yes stop_codon:yes gene_type:complete